MNAATPRIPAPARIRRYALCGYVTALPETWSGLRNWNWPKPTPPIGELSNRLTPAPNTIRRVRSLSFWPSVAFGSVASP